MDASDALSTLNMVYGIVKKVKENQTELLHLSNRIKHAILSLEDLKRRNVIRDTVYTDAISGIFHMILCMEGLAQRLSKRSLIDRTWNKAEITLEINRINEDLKSFLSVYMIEALDVVQSTSNEHFEILSAELQGISAKLVQLDNHLSPQGGDSTAGMVTQYQLQELGSFPPTRNPNHIIFQPLSIMGLPVPEKSGFISDTGTLHTMLEPTQITILINGLTTREGHHQCSIFLNLEPEASYKNVLKRITEAGYMCPDSLIEEDELQITVVDGASNYDATLFGGLQISRSEPLRWWYNNYSQYHGTTPVPVEEKTVDSLTLGTLNRICIGGVHIQFHRTLRVSDSSEKNYFTPVIDQYPIIPSSSLEAFLPVGMHGKEGFIMPMFKKEALSVSFTNSRNCGAAIRIFVGGVNTLSGSVVNQASIDLPEMGQDYIFLSPGSTTQVDGVVTGSRIVRQFVAMALGAGDTVEEQVAGTTGGGLLFEITPQRPPGGNWLLPGGSERLDDLQTPQELGLLNGNKLLFKITDIEKLHVNREWTPGKYACRVSNYSALSAVYPDYRRHYRIGSAMFGFPPATLPNDLGMLQHSVYQPNYHYSSSNSQLHNQPMLLGNQPMLLGNQPMLLGNQPRLLGFAAGGLISQEIYRNSPSEPWSAAEPVPSHCPSHWIMGIGVGGQIYQHIPRDSSNNLQKYDDTHRQQLTVHIVSPELWEHITRSPVPLVPLTREIYLQHNMQWFPAYEDPYYKHKVSAIPNTLAGIKPLVQLKEQNSNAVWVQDAGAHSVF
ncbi:hypothetical protein DFH08DRAFT_829132 [Mycena albidolilacea]|uniref:Uncharacterized protein n=1 Tax=Mycena albidolilacea TaxID=1033008 RepID=A0AAD7F6F6_9AGAR|nr:hypothetical protein DFH08DRAFT_829132 [Mycena albidolilacea]